jgi:hypothetical protein
MKIDRRRFLNDDLCGLSSGHVPDELPIALPSVERHRQNRDSTYEAISGKEVCWK